jgi:hypothetical protein
MNIKYQQMNPKGLYICKFPDNLYYLFYFISFDKKTSKIRGSWLLIDKYWGVRIEDYQKLLHPSNYLHLFSNDLSTAKYLHINTGLIQIKRFYNVEC